MFANMADLVRQSIRLSGGTELSFLTAGEVSSPTVLLLHGTPNSALMFRDVAPALAQVAYVIAPDLPGSGESEPLPQASFAAIGEAVQELLARLAAGPRFIYLHDWGTPVGLAIAMQAPELVLGLIVQNANAHEAGWGDGWDATRRFWAHPTASNLGKVTTHLTLEGTRDTYVSGVPNEVAALVPAAHWEEDWRAMNRPGHMQTQHALIADYGNYASRFAAIAKYLERWQPPAMMLWGRHDVYFELDEALCWMRALPRMEAHVLDAGHLLLETHGTRAVALMLDFIRLTMQRRRVACARDLGAAG